MKGFNSTEGPVSVGTSYSLVLAPISLGRHDVSITNLGATDVFVKLTGSLTEAQDTAANTNVYAQTVPPNATKTIRNVQTSANGVYAKSTATNNAVYVDRSPASSHG